MYFNSVLIKRAQGRKRFGRKNFKARYFRLTTQDLSYSKHKGKLFYHNVFLEHLNVVFILGLVGYISFNG